MAASQLPDPQWCERASLCASCGYSLDGLGYSGVCPECGLTFTSHQLILAGVPRTTTGSSGWRTLAWAAVIIAGVAHGNFWTLELAFSLWLLLLSTAIIAMALIFLLATSKRDRSGTERFVITPGGIQRLPLKFEPGSAALDPIFVPWGTANTVELTRISNVWRRLRIGTDAGRRLSNPGFDAGIRCPDAVAEQVRLDIAAAIQGRIDFTRSASPTHLPPVPPPAAAPSPAPPTPAAPRPT